MNETTNDEIGIAAYDANEKAGEFVQIAIVKPPARSFYLTRGEALLLAERIKRKAETLPSPKARAQ